MLLISQQHGNTGINNVDFISNKISIQKNMKLDKKKKQEIKKIVKEFNDRPDDLAKTLAEKFGLEYVE